MQQITLTMTTDGIPESVIAYVCQSPEDLRTLFDSVCPEEQE